MAYTHTLRICTGRVLRTTHAHKIFVRRQTFCMSSTPSFASSSGASSRRPRPKSAGLPSRPPTAAGSGGIICDNRISAARTPRRCPRTPTGFGRTVTITRNGATWSGDVTDLRRVLIDAVRTGDECRVAACVEATATVASSAVDDRGWPALCVLVEHGASPSIMRLLLEHGAKVEGRVPGSRQTALHLAASRGYQVRHAEMLSESHECLVQYGGLLQLLQQQHAEVKYTNRSALT